MNLKTFLLGTAACALLAAPSFAQDDTGVPPKHRHHADSVASRLDRMERIIEEQQAEIRQLKAQHGEAGASGGATSAGAAPPAQQQPQVTAQQFEALQNQVYEMSAANKGQAVVKIAKGRPTISSADGKWTFFPRVLVQGDWADYDPSKTGVTTAAALKKSGENFRRAQFGFQGTLAGDFGYKFIYDFGGTNGDESYQAYIGKSGTLTSTGAGTGPHIKEAWVSYHGILDPFTFQVGAFPPPTNLADATASDDLLLNERPSPGQLSRSLAGDDGRTAIGFTGFGPWWNASAFFTGDTVGKGDLLAPGSGQEAVVGRAAIAPWYDPDTNFNIHLGGNISYVIRPQQSTACTTTPTCTTGTYITFSDRPELRVDNVSFINSGAIAAQNAYAGGVEAAASWGPFLLEGENFWYGVERVPTPGKSNPNFGAWYVEGSWVITGEPRKYSTASASYARPSPSQPFDPAAGGWGAWELAGRYSSDDFEYHPGAADAVYGGKQNIWSIGLNWYPIDPLKVMFDFEDVDLKDIGGLTTPTSDHNGHFTALSTRVQISY